MGFIEFKLVHKPCDCIVPARKFASIGGGTARDSERVWLTDLPPDVFGAICYGW